MKKTLFVTMLATALMGGQVFAEVTGTAIDGAEHTQGVTYDGKYSEDGDANGGNVTIKADPLGEVSNYASVYGGSSTAADASNNTVVMTGGKVMSVFGGSAASSKEASNNVVIVTEGSITSFLRAANVDRGSSMNNKVYLVGKGASNVRIADAQGNISTYSGGTTGISLSGVRVAQVGTGTAEGNSIDIYGTGITVSGRFEMMQILTFNITDGQVSGTPANPALSLTSTSNALNLGGVTLQVNDLDVKAWTPGSTITLVQAAKEIQVGDDWGEGKVVDITKNGQVVALGQLVLSNENKTLSLSVQGIVPEPAAGTLGLLALAGLCVRRRRK